MVLVLFMLGDYVFSERRKSKRDKKAKRRKGVYKKGGKFRATAVKEGKKKRKGKN